MPGATDRGRPSISTAARPPAGSRRADNARSWSATVRRMRDSTDLRVAGRVAMAEGQTNPVGRARWCVPTPYGRRLVPARRSPPTRRKTWAESRRGLRDPSGSGELRAGARGRQRASPGTTSR